MSARITVPEAAAFAGRGAELSILTAAAEAAKTGQFSLVLVSGEPGIGKTRLAEAACGHAHRLGFPIAAGRCFDTQSRLSYYPFLQAFRQLASQPCPPVRAERR